MMMKSLLSALCMAVVYASSAYAEPALPVKAEKKTFYHAFDTGEKLTYTLSWLTLIDAGIAVMEVKGGVEADEKKTYRINCSAHSVGMLETFLPIRLATESIVRATDMNGLFFSLKEQYGSSKRKREFTFNHDENTVVYRPNDDPQEIHPVPPFIQDALSPIYYLRLRDDFVVEKPIRVTVFEKGKIWSVDIHTLGREQLKTPLGEFATIKIKTYISEGIFPNVGDIYIWLTDDARKIPVLVQCKLKIAYVGVGSLVATLTKIETEKTAHDIKERSQTAQ
jgi:hypothetical protein